MSTAVTLTLPTGKQYEQPTSIFIGNKFVQGSGDILDIIDPA